MGHTIHSASNMESSFVYQEKKKKKKVGQSILLSSIKQEFLF